MMTEGNTFIKSDKSLVESLKIYTSDQENTKECSKMYTIINQDEKMIESV